jgi:hypothetical protein
MFPRDSGIPSFDSGVVLIDAGAPDGGMDGGMDGGGTDAGPTTDAGLVDGGQGGNHDGGGCGCNIAHAPSLAVLGILLQMASSVRPRKSRRRLASGH